MGNILQLSATLTRIKDRSVHLSSAKIMVKGHYEIVRTEAYLGASVAQTQFEVQRYDVEVMEADHDQAFRFLNKDHYRASLPLK